MLEARKGSELNRRLSNGTYSPPVSEVMKFVGQIREIVKNCTPDFGSKRHRLLHNDTRNFARSRYEFYLSGCAKRVNPDALLRINAAESRAVRDLVAKHYPESVKAVDLVRAIREETAVSGFQDLATVDLLDGVTVQECDLLIERTRLQIEASTNLVLSIEAKRRELLSTESSKAAR